MRTVQKTLIRLLAGAAILAATPGTMAQAIEHTRQASTTLQISFKLVSTCQVTQKERDVSVACAVPDTAPGIRQITVDGTESRWLIEF